jgi:hypothetical protein
MPTLGTIKVYSFEPSGFLLALKSNKRDRLKTPPNLCFWYRVNIRALHE